MLKEKIHEMNDAELISLQQELYNTKGFYMEDSIVKKLIKECFPDEKLFILRITDVISVLLPEITDRFINYSNRLNRLSREEKLKREKDL